MAYKFAIKINDDKLFKITGDKFGETYKKVVNKAAELKRKHKDWKIYVISLTVPFKTPNKPNPCKRGVYWCPYCRAWREYYWDDWVGRWKCPVCGISTRDYYVKQCNGGSENVPW